jgi:hypothetical protein
MEDLSTYPTDIKLYEKLRIIGRGSFGQVICFDLSLMVL